MVFAISLLTTGILNKISNPAKFKISQKEECRVQSASQTRIDFCLSLSHPDCSGSAQRKQSGQKKFKVKEILSF